MNARQYRSGPVRVNPVLCYAPAPFMSLSGWSWAFLALYVGAMLTFGIVGRRRVKSADDFATARRGYGPVFLAFAFAATAASGATFVGFPGLGYRAGLATLWTVFLYPIGLYVGVLICVRVVSRTGDELGSRSIPEYLGQRYQSDAVRILVSVFSLLLLFYLAGQLVAGLVMFEVMLGVPSSVALGITAAVLMTYVVLGGAHADILTDGVQGFLMVLTGAGVAFMFATGFGVEGGFSGMVRNLEAQDPNLVGVLNPDHFLYSSWWAIVAIPLAHVPLGMLPHIGNKLWALDDPRKQRKFIVMAFGLALTLAMLGLGGVLARAVLGDALLQSEATTNHALPALFIELLPAWLAALLGIGILSAVMSTADGLVVSSSQIIANDLYRCTVVPRWQSHLSEAEVDARVLRLSRASTVLVLLVCAAMAWALMDRNVALIVTIGSGGLVAAFAGPLVLGAVWRGVTKTGAFAGLIGGVTVFAITHAALIDPSWFDEGALRSVAEWLHEQAPNPFSCATMGEIVSVALTWGVSRVTRPLDTDHVDVMFGVSKYGAGVDSSELVR